MTETAITDPAAHAVSLFRTWEAALEVKDLEQVLAVYRDDASIESPIIRRLLGQDQGVCHGKAGVQVFYEAIFAETGSLHLDVKPTPYTDGTRLLWQYERAIPGGQMDMAEVWDLEGGLVLRHRVYWGWAGMSRT